MGVCRASCRTVVVRNRRTGTIVGTSRGAVPTSGIAPVLTSRGGVYFIGQPVKLTPERAFHDDYAFTGNELGPHRMDATSFTLSVRGDTLLRTVAAGEFLVHHIELVHGYDDARALVVTRP
jgi:hypothetical protein